MSEKRISLGINVSIIVTLTIFGVLLSLPLRLLLDTSYYSRNETVGENSTVNATDNATIDAIPMDHKRLELCPRFDYEDNLKSVFRSDYDRNCTYAVFENDDSERYNRSDKYEDNEEDDDDTSEILKEINGENTTENVEESGKDRQSKSAVVAGHILVTMLLISAIAALVEVLRIRFARDKVLQRKPQ